MLFDIEFFIVLILFVFSLVLVISPVKGVGVVNFAFGLVTVMVASSVALGFTGATELYEQFFMLLVDVVGVYCMLRSDGIVRVH